MLASYIYDDFGHVYTNILPIAPVHEVLIDNTNYNQDEHQNKPTSSGGKTNSLRYK